MGGESGSAEASLPDLGNEFRGDIGKGMLEGNQRYRPHLCAVPKQTPDLRIGGGAIPKGHSHA
jgi:hypothetical protein